MFKKPTLNDIEKMLIPLRSMGNRWWMNRSESDYQYLQNYGRFWIRLSLFWLILALFEFGFRRHLTFFLGVSCFNMILTGFISLRYYQACKVMEEACPISLDDVRKKLNSPI
jgi:hypothetical protein